MENPGIRPFDRLPKELVARASLRGNEYAWRLADIPKVIEAVRRAGLVNLGGQLQFRFPDGGTCECYWIDIDTYKSVSQTLSWAERVAQTAEVASAEFARLSSELDFLEEGRRGFDKYLSEAEKDGGDPANAICFVWYILDEEEAKLERPASQNRKPHAP